LRYGNITGSKESQDPVQDRRGLVKAVDDVSYYIDEQEIVGVVGESGCGKSVSQLSVMRLINPPGKVVGGEILFEGQNLLQYSPNGAEMRSIRGAKIAMIFQEPMTSLNPVLTIGRQLQEMLELHLDMKGEAARKRATELLGLVGIPGAESRLDDYPHEFSGGQRQRIGVARALACEPTLIVCDEPISALDVSIQAQIINLLEELQEGLKGLTYIFIAHDLSVVKHISDRIAVMYLGRIVEITRPKELYENPLHPYAKALLSAVPVPDPDLEETRERIILKGEVPSPINPPAGCSFHERCWMAIPECSKAVPPLRDVGNGHQVACIRV